MSAEKRLSEIKNELTDIGIYKTNHDPASAELLSKYYYELFKETICSTCPGKLTDAYNRIINLNIQKFITMKNQKFRLKDNQNIQFMQGIPGVPEVLTNANLTDEIYHKVIKEHPAHKERFEEVDQPSKAAVEPEESATSAVAHGKDPQTKKDAETSVNGSARAQEIEANMNKDEIEKKLKKLKVEFNSSSTKAELAQLLAANEK